MNHYPIALLIGEKRQILNRFRGNGILTVLDYLRAKKPRLAESLITTKIPQADVESLLADLDRAIEKLKSLEEDLYEQLKQPQQLRPREYLSARGKQLIPLEHLTLITGEICSGKTTFLWSVISECYLRAPFYYCDCSGTFHAGRIHEILKRSMPEPQVQELLQSVKICSLATIKDFEGLLGDLCEMQSGVIIFDGLLTLYCEFDHEIYKLQHQICEIFKSMYELCSRNQHTIIVSLRSFLDNSTQVQSTKFDQFTAPYAQQRIKLHKQQKLIEIQGECYKYNLNEHGIIY